MKAITLYEPWASFIKWGWKKIETRTHDRFRSLEGQRIAIHCSKMFDYSFADEYFVDLIKPWQGVAILKAGEFGEFEKNKGAIICTAYVEGVRWLTKSDSQLALIDCPNLDRFGLFLTDIQEVFIPNIRGRQGIFEVPEELMRRHK